MGENAVTPLARNNPNGGAHALAARRTSGRPSPLPSTGKATASGTALATTSEMAKVTGVSAVLDPASAGAIGGVAERVPPNANLAGNEHLVRFPARV